MQCMNCKTVGTMRRCKECGQVYCRLCAEKGKGPYPKVYAGQCPWCGKIGRSEIAK